MNVCASVIKHREKKSIFRHFHDPVADTVLDQVCFRIIAKSRLGQLHRADAAKNVLVDFLGSVVHLNAVRGFSRNIVYGMDKDYVIILRVVIVLDNFVVKAFDQLVIL